MKNVILQAIDDRCYKLSDVTSPAIEAWGKKHGWGYHCICHNRGATHPYLYRYRDILKQLDNGAELVFYLDVDIVPISGGPIYVAPHADIMVSTDAWGYCLGAMIVRSTTLARSVMEILATMTQDFSITRTQDVPLFTQIANAPGINAHHIIPIDESQVRNPSTRQDFPWPPVLYHFWGNNKNEEQSIAEAKMWLEKK